MLFKSCDFQFNSVHLHMLWNALISFFISLQKHGICCDIWWSYFSADQCWSVDGCCLNELRVCGLPIHMRYSYSATNTRTLFRVSLPTLTQYVIGCSLFVVFSSYWSVASTLMNDALLFHQWKENSFFRYILCEIHFLICLILEYSDNAISIIIFGYI